MMTNMNVKKHWSDAWTEADVALLDNPTLCNLEIAEMLGREPIDVGIFALRTGRGLRRHKQPLSEKECDYMIFEMQFSTCCRYMLATYLSRTCFSINQLSVSIREANPGLVKPGINRKGLKSARLRPVEPPVKGKPAVVWVGTEELPVIKPVEEYKLVQEIDGVEPAPWRDEPETGLEQLAKRMEDQTNMIHIPDMLATKLRLLKSISGEHQTNLDVVDALVTEALKQQVARLGVLA